MTKLYPASKDKIIDVSSFAMENYISNSTEIYI